MNAPRAPRLAQALLRRFVKSRYSECFEGDLLEELAAGRTNLWYWRQVGFALCVQGCFVARQQMVAFVAATAFFMLALWAIAPATYPLMDWARTEPLRTVVLLGWLTGVPLVLGVIAGATERRRRIPAILLGAAIAYLTPVTGPFDSAVCDLCVGPGSTSVPTTALWLAPLGSALLAGFGAWLAGRFRPAATERAFR
jgi:hypothetical protein